MDEYAVSASPFVIDQFKQALEVARASGAYPKASRAMRWILEELARTPMQFGESRSYLPNLQLHLRIAFAGPFSVWFAVHETSMQVFVTAVSINV